MRLIIGPTCGGKSTYISTALAHLESASPLVHFGFSFLEDETTTIPSGPRDVVHYNLLHTFRRASRAQASLAGDTLLKDLLDAAAEVVVVSAPRSVLLRRAEQRTHAEPGHEEFDDRLYYHEDWLPALSIPDLAQVYEHLALMLDEAGVPAQYFCSHADVHGGLQQVSRWELPRLAGGDAEERCRHGHVLPDAPALSGQQRSYQADHRIGAVSATISRALRMPLAGRSLLDIGCAEGEVALSAARMGARVTGIEPRPRRLAQARLTAETLGLDVDLRRLALDDLLDRPRTYDVVVALNVAHHVRNPFGFLDRAGHLSCSHLVLEYPGLADEKFRATLPDGQKVDDDQPLVGVSLREQDQTFVFTPAALERYFLDTVGLFRHHRLVESPMPHRWISVFSGRRTPDVHPAPTVAQLRAKVDSRERKLEKRERQLAKRSRQLERRNEQLRSRERDLVALRQRLAEIESSRSWRLTAPLRGVSRRAAGLGRPAR
ncbi:MAG TPA: methyltransferase domain-containing protein [Nocardioidaceae bacterium]|nr:methyltransferase domain-containing protein [Nocardioidaceae bacterium]